MSQRDVAPPFRSLAGPEATAKRLGFAAERQLATPDGALAAAIWRFQHKSSYELRRHADRSTNVIAIPISGWHHHTYFGDGHLKWSGPHPAFHLNIVVVGEQPHGLFRSDRPFTYLHVYVRQAMVEQLATASGALTAGRTVTLVDPMCAHDPFVESVCRQILREMTCGDKVSRVMLEALGRQLVGGLLRRHSNLAETTALPPYDVAGYRDRRLRYAIEYLEAHLADDLGPGRLAAVVGLSAAHLTTLFREGTGDPPYRWLMNRRFHRACELLGESALSVTAIAHQCGFASSQHLAVVMRRRLATTPTAYRRQVLGYPPPSADQERRTPCPSTGA